MNNHLTVVSLCAVLTQLSPFSTDWLKDHQYQLLPIVPCDETGKATQ